jgi:MFS transporter, DHA2 family, multidrug resistance protein
MSKPGHPPNASLQDWVAVLAGSLGALIASLDISIVNSALPQIQGEIGASGTEGTWIATGYLVSEVVMIPLTAWLTRTFGMRNLLLGCAVLFTVFSMICGGSTSLPGMIFGRVGQGFFGGALIPTAQTIVRTRLPMHQLPLGMSIFGLIVLLGPLVGPVIGGWLTESVSWRWCFFLNLPIAGGLVTLLLLGLPKEKSNIIDLIHADWLGIIGMSAGLSCLTVVLEEGQRDRWFESQMIVSLTIASAIGFVLLAIAQVTSRRPVIKLRLMLNRSYAAVITIVTVAGMALYGILYVIPQFLAGVSGYNAEQSGRILFLSGIPAILMMPILPIVMRVNLRVLVLCGLLCFGVSCFMDTHLTAASSGGDFVISQLLRGMGQILSMLPLNQASVGAVSREDTADAAGLYNMARNLGGSMGLALLGVFIDRQSASHVQTIGASVTANSPLAQAQIAGQAQTYVAQNGGDLAGGQMHAFAQLAATVQQQATVITYSDCFWVLGVAMFAMMPLVFLLRPPPANASRLQAAH